MYIHKLFVSVLFLLLITSCSKDSGEQELGQINVFSVTIEGGKVISGMDNISINPKLRFVFSKSIDLNSFEQALKINPSSNLTIASINYLNNSSAIEVLLNLEYNSTYEVELEGAIGINGEALSEVINFSFKTQVDDTIYERPACLNGNDCKQSVLISNATGEGNFDFYANYPIYEDNAQWQNLEKAVIVVHGASINPDDYYGYMTTTFEALGISEKTVLIAPDFKSSEVSSGDLYWSSLGYRDGKASNGTTKISSFEVLDILINRLADKNHFPVLNEIVVTGQSSGGRFVHTYAAGNRSESTHTDIHFEYIVSESQYFYYPTNQRIDEQTNNLYVPSNCNGLRFWPFGYELAPDYVNVLDKTAFDERFVNRSITYLLGNGSGTDSELNISDCEAVLSGSSRYQRGENMYLYMGLKLPGHNHKKTITQGISHNGSAIYTSPEFKALLNQLFNN
ncbi:Ig-like domain-containing protein [Gaetbulibacter aquiaggeris]|uniref:Ig-like domain-containing protein n=1 Tax=Gaetbulibacter aquiaggeris TaxID=1735373 RepID=A0ABW7MQB8_9FLAO